MFRSTILLKVISKISKNQKRSKWPQFDFAAINDVHNTAVYFSIANLYTKLKS